MTQNTTIPVHHHWHYLFGVLLVISTSTYAVAALRPARPGPPNPPSGLIAPASSPGPPPRFPRSSPAAKDLVLTLDAPNSKLHWTLGTTLHTVHGTFAFARGFLRVESASGKASGEIVANARSGDSGDSSRDKKMHKEVLESARFTEVTFRPDHLEGQIPLHGAANVQLHGVFLLHGSQHELTVPVEAEITSDHWKGTAKFRIPYIEWGLKSPNNFLLKADPVVDIDLDMNGTVHGAPDAPAN